jgi:hypothetical protein
MDVYCGATHCGQMLGEVHLSLVQSTPRPVWKIPAGWQFRQGILEFGDTRLRQEQELTQGILGLQVRQLGTGANVARECFLDRGVVVRCPKCRQPRFVPPNVFYRFPAGASACPPAVFV